MKPFAYVAPSTVQEAVQLLADRGTAALGGGTDLLSLMKDHIAEPARVVDLRGIPGLDTIDRHGSGLRIGTLVTLDRIESDEAIRTNYPMLAEAASVAASPQLRNMGTLGGNLCQRPRCWYYRGDYHCLRKGGNVCYAEAGENEYLAILGGGPCHIVHPSDLAPALMALDAEIVVESASGSRVVPAGEFFIGVEVSLTRETVLRDDEMITGVRLGRPATGAKSTYLKAMDRGAWSFALVSVAAQVVFDGPRVADARLVLGGVAPTPWRCRAAEERLTATVLDPAAIAEAAERAMDDARPMSKNAYKVDLARGLVGRALTHLASRAAT